MNKSTVKLVSIFLEIIILFSIIGVGDNRYEKIEEKLVIQKEVYDKDRLEKIEEKKKIEETLPKIICWGDSLTQGVGGNGVNYPSVLGNLIHLESKNFGVGGETAEAIAMRQGAVPIYADEFTIPKTTEKTEINIKDAQGNRVNLLGDAGVNPCILNGVKGNIEVDIKNQKYYFSRIEDGVETKVENNTLITTYSKNNINKDDIYVIFIGTNNKPASADIQSIIDIQKNMLHFTNADKYIIVGLTSKSYMPEVEQVNSIMKAEYGDKFLDIRRYILDHGLEDAEIKPTKQDLENIQNGEIPSSLRSDQVHGNEIFYRIIAKQIYKKIIELNYLNEDQKEYLKIKQLN